MRAKLLFTHLGVEHEQTIFIIAGAYHVTKENIWLNEDLLRQSIPTPRKTVTTEIEVAGQFLALHDPTRASDQLQYFTNVMQLEGVPLNYAMDLRNPNPPLPGW